MSHHVLCVLTKRWCWLCWFQHKNQFHLDFRWWRCCKQVLRPWSFEEQRPFSFFLLSRKKYLKTLVHNVVFFFLFLIEYVLKNLHSFFSRQNAGVSKNGLEEKDCTRNRRPRASPNWQRVGPGQWSVWPTLQVRSGFFWSHQKTELHGYPLSSALFGLFGLWNHREFQLTHLETSLFEKKIANEHLQCLMIFSFFLQSFVAKKGKTNTFRSIMSPVFVQKENV